MRSRNAFMKCDLSRKGEEKKEQQSLNTYNRLRSFPFWLKLYGVIRRRGKAFRLLLSLPHMLWPCSTRNRTFEPTGRSGLHSAPAIGYDRTAKFDVFLADSALFRSRRPSLNTRSMSNPVISLLATATLSSGAGPNGKGIIDFKSLVGWVESERRSWRPAVGLTESMTQCQWED